MHVLQGGAVCDYTWSLRMAIVITRWALVLILIPTHGTHTFLFFFPFGDLSKTALPARPHCEGC